MIEFTDADKEKAERLNKAIDEAHIKFCENESAYHRDKLARLEKTKELIGEGTKEERVEYRRGGVLHRDDGPAVEYSNGVELWFRNGVPYNGHSMKVVELEGKGKKTFFNGICAHHVLPSGETCAYEHSQDGMCLVD